MKIASLTGDREFIGAHWMASLAQKNIPFVLRLRENQHVVRDGYATWPISRIAQNLKRGETMTAKGTCHLGANAPQSRIVIMRLKTGELLALACRSRPHQALARYRHRWTIETLFANLKTRGFNMEQTHLANPKKLSTLMAILAITLALAVKTGVAANRVKPIPVKSHGRRAVSIFALGIAVLQKLCATPKSRRAKTSMDHIISTKITRKPLQTLAL